MPLRLLVAPQGLAVLKGFGLSVTVYHLDYDSRTVPVQKNTQLSHGGVPPSGCRPRHFGIRGDAILWFYPDCDDGEPRQHLLVAQLDDPGGAATVHYLDLDLSAVRDDHAYSRRSCYSSDTAFPVGARVSKY